jgi:SAM-dependent methyltransferase
MTSSALAGEMAASRPDERLPASMFETVTCYVCGSDRRAFFISAGDDLTGRPGRFTFVRCGECGLVYQAPRLLIEHVKSYYDSDYIAHQRSNPWGPLAPLFRWAMGSLDRAKVRIVSRYVALTPSSAVLDVGCGAGTFLSRIHDRFGSTVAGVDFVDLSARDNMRAVEFHHGVFGSQDVGDGRFDLVTMWHFLEHDYDPMGSLDHARRAMKPGGRLVIEVPRLDSLSFRIFGDRWPGLQAPQHTVAYDRAGLLRAVERMGFEVVAYHPYGAFPPYFYLFCGVAFKLLKGRGLDLRKSIYAYFAGQFLLLPLLPILPHVNFAMQIVVCRRKP